jgi:lysozyme family protein
VALDFDTAFARLISSEGEYVNDPADPGGETKFGISKRSYPNVDIKSLTLEGAKDIYRRDFWNVLSTTHSAVKFQAFDFAVNSGIQTAIRKLQVAVKVADDGHWGPISSAALEKMDLNDVLLRYIGLRLEFMTKLKTFGRFGAGWSARIAHNLLYAAEDN